MIRRYLLAITLSLQAAAGLIAGDRPVVAGGRSASPQARTPDSLGGQTTTRLPDGRLLRLGGEDSNGATWMGSVFDPSTQTTITLAGRMFEARAWHTATILPDGGVLIVGGRGATGEPLSSAERFDPGTETFAQVDMPDALPRTGHTATLLTDGRVLLAGGQTSGNVMAGVVEVWNLTDHRQTRIADPIPRVGHAATLLDDGQVVLAAGMDASGQQVVHAEVFDPGTNVLTPLTSREALAINSGVLKVTWLMPADGANDVPVDARITLRLSHAARVETITDQTVALSGPYGLVSARVIAAEGGRLVFVWPAAPLPAGTEFTFTVSAVADEYGASIVPLASRFATVQPSDQNNNADPEEWIPDAASMENGWRANRPPSPFPIIVIH